MSRCKIAKSSKRSCSKGNSLPPTKRFDFIMMDDDFEELQHGFIPKETNADTKKCVKLLGQCRHRCELIRKVFVYVAR